MNLHFKLSHFKWSIYFPYFSLPLKKCPTTEVSCPIGHRYTCIHIHVYIYFLSSSKDTFIDFKERRERKISISCLLCTPPLGIKPKTFLVHRPIFQPIKPPGQGWDIAFYPKMCCEKAMTSENDLKGKIRSSAGLRKG